MPVPFLSALAGVGRHGGRERVSAGSQQPGVQRLTDVWAESRWEKCEDTHAGNVLTDNADESWNSGRHARPGTPVELCLDLGAGGAYVDHIHLMPYQVTAVGKRLVMRALPPLRRAPPHATPLAPACPGANPCHHSTPSAARWSAGCGGGRARDTASCAAAACARWA